MAPQKIRWPRAQRSLNPSLVMERIIDKTSLIPVFHQQSDLLYILSFHIQYFKVLYLLKMKKLNLKISAWNGSINQQMQNLKTSNESKQAALQPGAQPALHFGEAVFMNFHSMTSSFLFKCDTTFSQAVTDKVIFATFPKMSTF